jgi:hypothetical protein
MEFKSNFQSMGKPNLNQNQEGEKNIENPIMFGRGKEN